MKSKVLRRIVLRRIASFAIALSFTTINGSIVKTNNAITKTYEPTKVVRKPIVEAYVAPVETTVPVVTTAIVTTTVAEVTSKIDVTIISSEELIKEGNPSGDLPAEYYVGNDENYAVQQNYVEQSDLSNSYSVSNVTGYDSVPVIDSFTEDDIMLLAKLIGEEGRGTPRDVRRHIGIVVCNRITSSFFPNTIREIIFQGNGAQYSTCYSLPKNPTQENIELATELLTEYVSTDWGNYCRKYWMTDKTVYQSNFKQKNCKVILEEFGIYSWYWHMYYAESIYDTSDSSQNPNIGWTSEMIDKRNAEEREEKLRLEEEKKRLEEEAAKAEEVESTTTAVTTTEVSDSMEEATKNDSIDDCEVSSITSVEETNENICTEVVVSEIPEEEVIPEE